MEIQPPPAMNNRQDRLVRRIVPTDRDRRQNRSYTYNQRPGLEDLV